MRFFLYGNIKANLPEGKAYGPRRGLMGWQICHTFIVSRDCPLIKPFEDEKKAVAKESLLDSIEDDFIQQHNLPPASANLREGGPNIRWRDLSPIKL